MDAEFLYKNLPKASGGTIVEDIHRKFGDCESIEESPNGGRERCESILVLARFGYHSEAKTGEVGRNDAVLGGKDRDEVPILEGR